MPVTNTITPEVRKSLVALLRREEGSRAYPYSDAHGRSIGIGHFIGNHSTNQLQQAIDASGHTGRYTAAQVLQGKKPLLPGPQERMFVTDVNRSIARTLRKWPELTSAPPNVQVNALGEGYRGAGALDSPKFLQNIRSNKLITAATEYKRRKELGNRKGVDRRIRGLSDAVAQWGMRNRRGAATVITKQQSFDTRVLTKQAATLGERVLSWLRSPSVRRVAPALAGGAAGHIIDRLRSMGRDEDEEARRSWLNRNAGMLTGAGLGAGFTAVQALDGVQRPNLPPPPKPVTDTGEATSPPPKPIAPATSGRVVAPSPAASAAVQAAPAAVQAAPAAGTVPETVGTGEKILRGVEGAAAVGFPGYFLGVQPIYEGWRAARGTAGPFLPGGRAALARSVGLRTLGGGALALAKFGIRDRAGRYVGGILGDSPTAADMRATLVPGAPPASGLNNYLSRAARTLGSYGAAGTVYGGLGGGVAEAVQSLRSPDVYGIQSDATIEGEYNAARRLRSKVGLNGGQLGDTAGHFARLYNNPANIFRDAGAIPAIAVRTSQLEDRTAADRDLAFKRVVNNITRSMLNGTSTQRGVERILAPWQGSLSPFEKEYFRRRTQAAARRINR